MSDPYDTWNQDLLYSSEVYTESTLIAVENNYSPARPQRFRVLMSSPTQTSSPLFLTPTLNRSPLQALKQTSEGLLYSPYRPRPDGGQDRNV